MPNSRLPRRLWPVGLYKVSGDSMLPTLHHGQILLGRRWFRPSVGQIVVAWTDQPLIKRITKLDREQVWLEGDNVSASTDSRYFGALPRRQLEAVIIARITRGR